MVSPTFLGGLQGNSFPMDVVGGKAIPIPLLKYFLAKLTRFFRR